MDSRHCRRSLRALQKPPRETFLGQKSRWITSYHHFLGGCESGWVTLAEEMRTRAPQTTSELLQVSATPVRFVMCSLDPRDCGNLHVDLPVGRQCKFQQRTRHYFPKASYSSPSERTPACKSMLPPIISVAALLEYRSCHETALPILMLRNTQYNMANENSHAQESSESETRERRDRLINSRT